MKNKNYIMRGNCLLDAILMATYSLISARPTVEVITDQYFIIRRKSQNKRKNRHHRKRSDDARGTGRNKTKTEEAARQTTGARGEKIENMSR